MELATILIFTSHDKHLVDATMAGLEESLKGIPYLPILVDGDNFPDITSCLNMGIGVALNNGCQFIHWVHTDMEYRDKNWFPTLRSILNKHPEILKICASNSRDEIGPLRIGQEQTWLMRTRDFTLHEWLWFDPRFIRCGGCEDYYQHLQILVHGFLILITPECTIYHKGAQTRSLYDTNPHQLKNQQLFGELTGYGQLVEVHDKGFFGAKYPFELRDQIINQLDPRLKELIQ